MSSAKPEDLFESLSILKKEQSKSEETNSGSKAAIAFMNRFGNRLTEEVTFNY